MNNGVAPITDKLLHKLEEQGYRGRSVSIHHVHELQEEIEGSYRQGLFDEGFYRESLTLLNFSPPDGLPDARSLIVVAIPQPQVRVSFTWNGKAMPLVVPPTYLHAGEIDGQVQDSLMEILEPAGYQLTRAALPKKLLAVRSGLGEYGRNNICYVDGMGSFQRLAAFYSDLPCQKDNWRESRMMAACEKCSACIRHCPTQAILSERFLLQAERCLTFHNELAGDVPFAGWIERAWHKTLVGCMHCQSICPQNKDYLGWVKEGAAFSEEETRLLVQGVPAEQLPAATLEKLEQSDLIGLVEFMPRNLGVLLA